MILAAGEGARVRDLTRDRWGLPAPKQYALIDGRSTLLDTTLARASRIAPPERTVAVVASHHRHWWTSELAELPVDNVLVQPDNRGTAAGVLLPLLWITRRDADARLVILPSDHGVTSEKTLLDAIAEAIACAPRDDAGIVMLGMRPDGPETDYGWVVPSRTGETQPFRVDCFREKPDGPTAARLLSRGGLLNSFILIAEGRRLCTLYRRTLPQLWRAFRLVMDELGNRSTLPPGAAHLYRSVPKLDFSRDLLERVTSALRVFPVPSCGWCDLGTPERLTDHLAARGPSQTRARPPATSFVFPTARSAARVRYRVLDRRETTTWIVNRERARARVDAARSGQKTEVVR